MPLTFHDYFIVEGACATFVLISCYWDEDFQELLPVILGRNLYHNVPSIRRQALVVFHDLTFYEIN